MDIMLPTPANRFQVLLYHGVSQSREEIRGKPLREFLARSEVLSQVRWLKSNGCEFLTLKQCRALALAQKMPPRAICLTFDDGKKSDLDLVAPLLAEEGICGSFFIIPGWVGRPNYLDRNELRMLSEQGMEIGSHSLSHPFMTALSPEEMKREAFGSKKYLEDLLGTSVESYSYPYGDVNARVRDTVAQAGYSIACGARRGSNTPGSDWLVLNRWPMHDTTGLAGLRRILESGRPSMLERGADWVKRALGMRRYVHLRQRVLRKAGD
jgi:peptidoglycan/xylan/chitin deacetylase (PgdA/CDA1 family)